MRTIRKLVTLLLAAAMCLSGVALAEEAPAITAADYLGEWVDQDGTVNIGIEPHFGEEGVDGYVVTVEKPVIEEEGLSYVVWAYGCIWDEEAKALTSVSRFTGKGDYEPGTEEEITDSNPEYTAAAFCFNADRQLTWIDENETADDGLLFVRPIGWGEVSPEDFLGEWVDQDGTVNIEIIAHMDETIDGYVVTVEKPVIEEEGLSYVVWAYGCVWDDETKVLTSTLLITGQGDYEPDSEEEITGYEPDYTSAVFSLNDNNQLFWIDENETADDGLVFDRPIGWDEESMPSAAEAFAGVWQCDRATIFMDWEEEGFKVLITWGSSAWEHSEWEYSCYYMEEDNTLVSMPFGTRTDLVYDENGELTSATEVYDDGEAIFSLDDEGKLIWQDQKENAGEGMRFEKIPEEPAVLTYATIGDAKNAEGFTGIAGGDDRHYVVVVEQDGAYLRVVADEDDEARRLGDATLDYVDPETLSAAFAAYEDYVNTLPVAYEEEITAQPLSQEELDALVGKTLLELENAGYYSSSSEMGENDEAIYTVSYGLYEYDLLLNATYTEYTESENYGELTVKSASYRGISRNAMELRYHADGTYDEENDPWAEYNAFMDLITNALSSDNPEEAVQALIDAMPDRAEEIQMLAEIFAAVTESAGE